MVGLTLLKLIYNSYFMTHQVFSQIECANAWAKAYYVDDAPIASDEEYDTLYHEILRYEQENPLFADEANPTKRVGGMVLGALIKRPTKPVCGAWKMSLMKMSLMRG